MESKADTPPHIEIVFEDAFEGLDVANLAVDDENGGQRIHGACPTRSCKRRSR